TTNSPLMAKRRAVASPIPLAPPAIIDIFLASFMVDNGVTCVIFD
ncbi:hypothetical protein Tco_0082476, partial [Tanacetum coccineum]